MSKAGAELKSRNVAFRAAWEILTAKNPLPAVCGRVCPHPCETACNRCDRDCGVAINNVERFLGDWALEHGYEHEKLTDDLRAEKIAVIGSGPAGLSCAYHLARLGYQVTIFEKFAEPGGMLRYGIPSYRLPRDVIDKEIASILSLGIELRSGIEIGRDISLDELKTQYNAVFLGIGAHRGTELHCKGEDAGGVYTGVDFLRVVNEGGKVDLGMRTAVIGGGDTAIDAARVSLRLGARVTIVYHRTREEMPAIETEISDAEGEGVEFVYLAAPLEIKSENDRVRELICQKMKLGDLDETGRRRPLPIKNETFELDADSIIIAVSQLPAWGGLSGLEDKAGWIEADGWGRTSCDNLYAGGDVEKLGLVTSAIADGRKAANAIHAKFRSLELPSEPAGEVIGADCLELSTIEPTERHENQVISVYERLQEPWKEFSCTLSPDKAICEANRCISCGQSYVKKEGFNLLHAVRRFSQVGVGTLLFNSYFTIFSTSQVSDGPLRGICVPGLNCHACPTALMGCPIGMLQHFAATHRFPWMLIGFLGVIGLLSGRFTCGWLCPFGLVQDLTHAFRRFTLRIPKILTYLKYAVLLVVVLIIPYFTYEHWFSKLCPCGALIAGIPWALWNPVDPVFGESVIAPSQIGALFWTKMWILGIFLVLFLFIKRPFCRTICPLGAIYALFNRVSLVSLRLNENCSDCGQCRALCPVDLDPNRDIDSESCIKCLECTQCQHIKFKWNVPWKNSREKPANKVKPVISPIPTISDAADSTQSGA